MKLSRIQGLTRIEKESIYLKAIFDYINDMVNYEVMAFGGTPPKEIRFSSSTHAKYFNILLVDFLSCSDMKILGEKKSYLSALSSICANPCLSEECFVAELKKAATDFSSWLNKEAIVETWLPSIDTQTDLKLTRFEFLKVCGNISKHNLTRLSSTASLLREIVARNSNPISVEESLLIMDDFYERFHTDVMIYHSSTIAEFLNNIRWGIYEYLRPEFARSIVWERASYPKYHYTYPEGITNEFAKNSYWELMNDVREKPWVPKFTVPDYFKWRY